MAMFWRLVPPERGDDATVPRAHTADEDASKLSNADFNINANSSHASDQEFHHPTAPAVSASSQRPDSPSTPPHNSPNDDLTIIRPATHTYVVTTSHLVRSGPSATIEEPAIRTEVISVCFSADRAREVARLVWRQKFAYAIPEGRVEEFDGVDWEYLFRPRSRSVDGRGARGCDVDDGGGGGGGGGAGDGDTDGDGSEVREEESVELLRLMNKPFVDGEDGHEVLGGERRVGVWRVGVDGREGVVGDGDGARTPESV